MTELSPIDAPKPQIAAALCSIGSLDLIDRQLESLANQTLGLKDFEIILVVGGNQASAIRPLIKARPHLPVQFIDRPESNLAILRHVALAQAVAPVILFLGPLDLPGSSLLAQHAHSHHLFPEPNVVIQGYNGLDPTLLRRPIGQFMTTTGRLGGSYTGAVSDRWLDGNWFTEGRCSCKCALLRNVGSFDSEFGAGAEWADLARRLAPQGLRILYNSRAISTIMGPATLDEFCLESERQGQADRILMQRWPDAIAAHKAELLRATDRVERLRARSAQLFAVTRRLNEMAELRIQNDIELDADFTALLHTHYTDTLDAFWLRGVEAAETQRDRMIA